MKTTVSTFERHHDIGDYRVTARVVVEDRGDGRQTTKRCVIAPSLLAVGMPPHIAFLVSKALLVASREVQKLGGPAPKK